VEMDAVSRNCRRVDWNKTTLFPKGSGFAAAPLACWPVRLRSCETRQPSNFASWLRFLCENGAYVPPSTTDWQVSNG
jgi:hypothetical protein